MVFRIIGEILSFLLKPLRNIYVSGINYYIPLQPTVAEVVQKNHKPWHATISREPLKKKVATLRFVSRVNMKHNPQQPRRHNNGSYFRYIRSVRNSTRTGTKTR